MQIKLFIFSVLLGTAFILSKTLNMNTFCPHLINNNINNLDASTLPYYLFQCISKHAENLFKHHVQIPTNHNEIRLLEFVNNLPFGYK